MSGQYGVPFAEAEARMQLVRPAISCNWSAPRATSRMPVRVGIIYEDNGPRLSCVHIVCGAPSGKPKNGNAIRKIRRRFANIGDARHVTHARIGRIASNVRPLVSIHSLIHRVTWHTHGAAWHPAPNAASWSHRG